MTPSHNFHFLYRKMAAWQKDELEKHRIDFPILSKRYAYLVSLTASNFMSPAQSVQKRIARTRKDLLHKRRKENIFISPLKESGTGRLMCDLHERWSDDYIASVPSRNSKGIYDT
ncbi:MAG: hypothetical protein HQK54_03660 [Oligoflexales bacterium]|nr:hypothetical protein [Oligoflexales bacterium]